MYVLRTKIFFNNHSTVIKFRKFKINKYLYLIYRAQSNFVNCPNNVLHSISSLLLYRIWPSTTYWIFVSFLWVVFHFPIFNRIFNVFFSVFRNSVLEVLALYLWYMLQKFSYNLSFDSWLCWWYVSAHATLQKCFLMWNLFLYLNFES